MRFAKKQAQLASDLGQVPGTCELGRAHGTGKTTGAILAADDAPPSPLQNPVVHEDQITGNADQSGADDQGGAQAADSAVSNTQPEERSEPSVPSHSFMFLS